MDDAIVIKEQTAWVSEKNYSWPLLGAVIFLHGVLLWCSYYGVHSVDSPPSVIPVGLQIVTESAEKVELLPLQKKVSRVTNNRPVLMPSLVTKEADKASISPAIPMTSSNVSTTENKNGYVKEISGSEVITAAQFDAEYLKNPKPIYPKREYDMGIEGTVLLRVKVTADGRAAEIEKLKSSKSVVLDNAAINTVKKMWRFVPAMKGKAPVESWVQVPITFEVK
jgi:protein TonB